MTEPRHLLITGPGRSGSTVLQRILGQLPGVHMAGESGWAARDLVSNTCSCDRIASDCPHWTAVRAHLGWSAEDWEQAAAHAVWVHRHWNFWRVANRTDHPRVQAYARQQLDLLDAHAAVAGTPWTVDATKYAARALALWRLQPQRVRILWWTRNPADLIRAWAKGQQRLEQPARSSIWVAAYDAMTSAQYRRLSAEAPLGALTYDQLANEPESTAPALAALLGTSPAPLIDALAEPTLARGHLLTGNRNRHHDLAWTPEPPAPPSRASALMREIRVFLEAP